jgi:transposase-like protein
MQKMNQNKRKAFAAAEKAALLKSYQNTKKSRKMWCEENGICPSTLHRWIRQEKSSLTPQPLQNWVPVISTAPAQSKVLEIQIGKWKTQ